MLSPFHVAVPVYDLESCKEFYTHLLGCTLGRTSDHWIDLNFFGHQFVLHYKPKEDFPDNHFNPVDGKSVPVPHYGVVLPMEMWKNLADSLTGKVDFIIEPYIRFEGLPGEQATMFFSDPCGNALEFKAFANQDELFKPFDSDQ
jgi:extradiol dioxygenase family protein